MCEFVFVFIQKKIDSSGRCFVLDIFDKRMKKKIFSIFYAYGYYTIHHT